MSNPRYYDELHAAYPSDVADSLFHRLTENMKNCDFITDVRVADVTKPAEVVRYLEVVRNGCCGSSNDLMRLGDTFYMIGFNFGH